MNVRAYGLREQALGMTSNSAARRDFAVLPLLLAAVFLAYGNTLRYPFVYDDQTAIVHNGFIKNLSHLPGLLRRRDYASGIDMRYRPLPAAGYFLLYRFWGLNPAGYRLGKLLLHLGNGWAVFLLARCYLEASAERPPRRAAGNSRGGAAFAALLFLLHPVQAEAINCVSFYHDLAATGFVLVAVLSVLAYSRRPAPLFLGVSLAAYLAALACKETALIFLPLLLLFPWAFPSIRARSESPFPRSLPFWSAALAMTAIYALALFVWFKRGGTHSPTPSIPAERTVLFFRCLLHYFRLLVFPAKLSLDYSPPLRLLVFRAPFWLAASGGLSLAILALRGAAVVRPLRFPSVWVALGLLPFLHLVPLPQIAAERYLYLPLVGWSCLAAYGASKLAERLAERRWAGRSLKFGLAALLAAVLVLARSNNLRWRDEMTLWRETLRVSPESPVALNNLGWEYFRRGDATAAERYFSRALELAQAPNVRSAACANLAVVAISRQCLEEALRRTAEAHREDPRSARPYRLEGQIFLMKNSYGKAAEALSRALELAPYDSESYGLLGCLLAETGKTARAKESFRKALSLDPDNPAARNNLRQVERAHPSEPGD